MELWELGIVDKIVGIALALASFIVPIVLLRWLGPRPPKEKKRRSRKS